MCIVSGPPPTLAEETNASPLFRAFVKSMLVKDPAKRPFAADLRPHAFVRGARPEPLRSLVEEQMVEQELKRSSQPAYRHHTNQQQPSPPPPPPPPPPAPMGRTASGGRVAAAAAAARDWSSSSSFNGGTAEPAAAARGHKPHVERDLDVRDVFDTADIAT